MTKTINIITTLVIISIFAVAIFAISKIKMPKYEYKDIVTPWDECKKAGGIYISGFFQNNCVFPPK